MALKKREFTPESGTVDTYVNIKRVYVTKFLGVHIDSHLNWGEHINHIKSKISKNVSIMRRVPKHLLIDSALYSLYSTLVMPYLNYVVKFGEIPTRVKYNLCILFRNELSVFAKRLIICLILDHFSTN